MIRRPPKSTLFPYTRSSDLILMYPNALPEAADDAIGADLIPTLTDLDAARTYDDAAARRARDRKSTRLNSSHTVISYAVFCLKKKNSQSIHTHPTTATHM